MQSNLSQEEVFRYARHLVIPGVGLEGQLKIKNASVLIIGTGGLGSPIALYLAAAGVGKIGLVDFDFVDRSNLQRQIIHDSQHIDLLKVDSARQRMLDLNPSIQVEAIADAFTPENALQISQGYDILLDGTDNFYSRYLINDVCVLTGKTYIYGSIFQFEGQVSVFDARRGPCYRCIFPTPPPAETIPSGNQTGVFGVLPGTIGTLQASEALKIILGLGTTLIGQLVLYDALEMSFQKIQLRKNPACKICGSTAEITAIDPKHGLYQEIDKSPASLEFTISPEELQAAIQTAAPIQIIDLRESGELQISQFPGAHHLPMGQLSFRLNEIDPTKEIVLVCRTGIRAVWVMATLKSHGINKVKVLRGGINAWAQQIDPKIYQY